MNKKFALSDADIAAFLCILDIVPYVLYDYQDTDSIFYKQSCLSARLKLESLNLESISDSEIKSMVFSLYAATQIFSGEIPVDQEDLSALSQFRFDINRLASTFVNEINELTTIH